VEYWYRGTAYRESTGTPDDGLARAYLDRRVAEKRAAAEGLLSFTGPQRATMAELLTNLEADYRIRGHKSLVQDKWRLARLGERVGDVKAIEISTPWLRRYVTQRQGDGAKPATVNRELAAMRRAMNLAREDGLLREVPRFPHLREDNARQGFFEPDEVDRVISHLPDYLKDLVRFAWLTGWRKGEILGLTWDWVDLPGRAIRLPTSKNDRGRLLALEGELWELIQRRSEHRSGPWVFHRQGQQIRDIREAWASACRAAGVQGRVLHDLRRSAARNLIRAGISEKVVMSITGHRTRSMLDRYLITSEVDLRAAMQRLNDYLAVRVDRSDQSPEVAVTG
jgi:integrase